MPESLTVAAFDLDGTITRKDTLSEFIKFSLGKPRWYIGLAMLSAMLVRFKLGMLDNQTAKEKLLTYFLGGMPLPSLYQKGEQFCAERMPSLVKTSAMAKIAWHKEQGHKLYLVTASLSLWTKAWADQQGMQLIASIPEEDSGVFTGKLFGGNCYGEEKRKRLEEQLNGFQIEARYAYGDTKGDFEMLAWADHAFYRQFQ